MKRKIVSVICMLFFVFSVPLVAQWDCTVSSSSDENVGRCFEREGGSGNTCSPPGFWDFLFTKCSGNIYTIIVTPIPE